MLNKYSSVPLYYQLKTELEKEIKEGIYKPGDLIPSENELAAKYSLSRPTVRQALAELVNTNYLVKVKGKGTFVSNFNHIVDYDHTKGFLYCLLDAIDVSNRKIIESSTLTAWPELKEKFKMDSNALYHDEYNKITYTTTKDNIKAYSISYLPLNYFPNGKELLDRNSNSIDLLVGKYPLDPTNAKVDIELVNADKTIAKEMDLIEGTPLFKVETYLFGRTGNQVEYNISYFNGFASKLTFSKARRI